MGEYTNRTCRNGLPVSNRNKPGDKVEATIDVFFDGTCSKI